MNQNKHDWSLEIADIRRMGLEGMTLTAIGQVYGVSSTYIKRLIKKFNIFSENEVYGLAVKKAERKHALFLKYGVNDGSDLYKAKREKFIRKKSFAKQNKIAFDINFGETEFPSHCPILGIKLDYFVKGAPTENSPSFDRIDSSKGYVKGNVQIISNKANIMKSNASLEEIEALYFYMKNKLSA